MHSYQLPLTPPDSGSEYGYSHLQYPQDLYSHQGLSQRQDMAYDYSQSYMPPMMPSYTSAYQPNMYQSTAGAISSTTLPSISSYYEPIGAPILPPLRIQDRAASSDGYQQRTATRDFAQNAPRQKEERAVGGVSAKLDYDMDRMTNFVVSTTQHMYDLHCSPICLADIDITRSFQQNVSSPPAFRKWVHQVLAATRLPSATILLSLHYLSERLRLFPDSVPVSETQIYRLLAVALILGSKFLDDNTFINRSWSDVTAIKVSELNTLEIKWLGLIKYRLHVNSSCVQTWLDLWNKFDAEQSREQATVRLSPLDTSMSRHPSSTRSRYSPYPTPYSSSTMSSRTFGTPANSLHRAAYSAVDPWSSTDKAYEEYYKRSNDSRYAFGSDDNRRMAGDHFRSDYQSYQAYPATAYSAAGAPSQMSSWDMHGWYSTHRADCTCTNCAYRAWAPYTVAGSYGVGTVMG